MEKAIELAIIILSLYYIGLPLFKRQVHGTDASHIAGQENLHRLLVLKENAYSTIKDIEFDYKSGKISEEDYQGLMVKYEAEAIDILKEIEHLKEDLTRRRKNNVSFQ